MSEDNLLLILLPSALPRLSGSRISSVRDLGTTLRSLQVLWMSRCGLQDLDGIGSIGTLRVSKLFSALFRFSSFFSQVYMKLIS